jgi:hypothetical protein
MAIVRWNPQRDLMQMREEMDRLFNQFLRRGEGEEATLAQGLWAPPVDIYYEPFIQRVSQDVMIILQNGGERAAVRRAVRMQVIAVLGEGEVTAVSVQQIAYAAMRGSFQAAEQTGVPIEIVGEEASAGVLEGVKEKGGKATSYLQEAIQGAMAAVEESVAKLKAIASEVAEKSRKALQSLIERLKGSPQGIGGRVR